MTSTLTTVPVTAEGIACGKCSHWSDGRKVTVRHASVAAVRLCATGPAVPATCVCTDADGFGHTCARFPNGTPVGDGTVDRAAQAIADAQAHVARHPERFDPATVALAMGGAVNAGDDTVRREGALPPVPGMPARVAAAVVANPVVTDVRVTRDAESRLPAGRYAIVDAQGVTRFYVVDRPTEGRWAGYTFVSVQAGDDLHPVKDRARRIGILAAIIVDPEGASRRYGRELGRCGVCNRTLTDPDSISQGIGPICAAKF